MRRDTLPTRARGTPTCSTGRHIRPGLGVHDLAYAIVSRYPHRTPASERELVGRYHDGLRAAGVAHYSWGRCWEDYRRAAAEQLIVPLSWQATDGLFVGRALAAFHDLACDEFIL